MKIYAVKVRQDFGHTVDFFCFVCGLCGRDEILAVLSAAIFVVGSMLVVVSRGQLDIV